MEDKRRRKREGEEDDIIVLATMIEGHIILNSLQVRPLIDKRE